MSQYTQSQKGKQKAVPQAAHYARSDSGEESEEDAPVRPSSTAVGRAIPPEARPSEPDDLVRPAGLEPTGPSPPFGGLTGMLDYFEGHLRHKHKKPADKGKMLGEFFGFWRERVGKDLYPVIRLLLPDRDNRRRNYSLKEQKLAKALIKALDLPPGSRDAMRLLSWKVPTREDPGAGEFSTVAYDAIKTRSTVITEMGSMTIDQVNDCLDELAKATLGKGGNARKEAVGEAHARILKDAVGKMTATEMKWFIRIILRDLKISISERTVFNAMHLDAVDAFNTCSDIKSVCWTLYDTSKRLESKEKDISLNKAFKPMLCYRSQRDLSTIVKTMRAPSSRPPAYDVPRSEEDKKNRLFCSKEEFLVEEKLDGERMQLHKSGFRWSYMSRKGTNYTHHYGANAAEGSLTPYIHDVFKPEIIDVILDGEMLVWEPRLRKYMPFGNLKSFSSKTTFGPNDPRPVFKVFDVLYIRTTRGGQSLLEVPLYKRKQLLESIFTPKPGVIEFADTTKASTTAELKGFLERILEERGEGLVVKHPLSSYILAGRQQTWIKVKPDYMDELGESVPGMVVGAYWGQGGRGGFLASFLIGLRDDSKPVDANGNPHYASFAKVGTGFNYEDYKWIQENTRDKDRNYWFDFNKKKLPPYFSTINEYPDQLIAPVDSFLIEVKAAEIVPGKDYAAGFTFRFPRAKFVYKHAEERPYKLEKAMSLQEVKDLKKKERKVVGSDLSGKNKKAKVATASTMRPSHISKPVGDYEEKTKIFEGLKFYVHNLKHIDKSKEFVDKDALQRIILENGGDFIQRIPDPSPDRRVIASQLQGVKNKAGADKADILLPDWVLESVKHRRCLSMTKRFFVKATDETARSQEYNAIDKIDDPMGQAEDEEEEADEGIIVVKKEEDLADSDGDTENVLKPLLGQMNINTATEDPQAPPRERWHDEASDDALSSDSGSEPATEDEDDGLAPPMSSAGMEPVQTQVDDLALTDSNPGLGAGEMAMEYDPEKLFDRLVAYFDTSSNAEINSLARSATPQAEQVRADTALAGAREAFISNGGTVTDSILDPKLTHLVVYNTVRHRFKELTRKTMEPRMRKMCTHDWILDSVDESAVVDEHDYAP